MTSKQDPHLLHTRMLPDQIHRHRVSALHCKLPNAGSIDAFNGISNKERSGMTRMMGGSAG